MTDYDELCEAIANAIESTARLIDSYSTESVQDQLNRIAHDWRSRKTVKCIPPAGWNVWERMIPSGGSFIWMLYDEQKNFEEPQLAKVCKTSCCVNAGFGSMITPKFWKYATGEEAKMKQAEFDAANTRSTAHGGMADLYER